VYDSRIGRFFVVDPAAQRMPYQSPYLYAADNPILFIDKNGLWHEVGYGGSLMMDKGDTPQSLQKYMKEQYGESISMAQARQLYANASGNNGWVHASDAQAAGIDHDLYTFWGSVGQFFYDLDQGGSSDGDLGGGKLGGTTGWNNGGKQLFFGTVGALFSGATIVVGGAAAGTYGTVLAVINYSSLANNVDNMLGTIVYQSGDSFLVTSSDNREVKLTIQGLKGAIDATDAVTGLGQFKAAEVYTKMFQIVETADDVNDVVIDYNTFMRILQDDKNETKEKE